MSIELHYKVVELNTRYVETIDDDRLEEWPDFFSDRCRYIIATAENVTRGFPIGLMYATSRAMLRDRIKALRDANVYEAQRYRHVLGPARIVESSSASVRARTNFIVARIMHTGETSVFATGVYDDRIALDGPAPVFAEKTVIIDSRQIDTLLAIPL